MNKDNIKYWYEGDQYHAEWADRALDDDDRYEDDSIIICVSVDATGDKNKDEKNVNTEMCAALDKWFEETR